jgi:hypothetical protein
MGNSNTTLQAIIDSISTIGDLMPVLVSTGGFSSEPALTIANDVVMEMFSERFPWKWNRMKIPPFPLNNRQQDYAMWITNLGWLENGYRVDMNSTQVPPPIWPLTVVRDLPISRVAAGWPTKACWFQNDQLEQGVWPGTGVTYTDPFGQPNMPSNPPTNIVLADGTILILSQYGVTGTSVPVTPNPPDPANPPPNWPVGAVIEDGSCQWTVVDGSAQGIRMWPPPPDSSGNVWLVRLFAQKKAPVITDITLPLNPIPDDQIKWFRDGFIAYCHRHSTAPAVKARFPQAKADWIAAMTQATKQADREDENYGFYPATGILSPQYYSDPGPGNPYWRQWGGS